MSRINSTVLKKSTIEDEVTKNLRFFVTSGLIEGELCEVIR